MTADTAGDGVGAQRRRRNAEATREAILTSALAAFTRAGYDGAGVREVAGAAGVTAMLVNRYFGSKEELFAEVVDRAFAPHTVLGHYLGHDLGHDLGALAEQTANRLVERTGPAAENLDPFLLMLRSVANPRAAEIIRTGIQRHAGRHLADLLPGPDAAQRAELLLSLIAGVWLMRKVVGTPALSATDPATLARQLEELIQVVVGRPPHPGTGAEPTS